MSTNYNLVGSFTNTYYGSVTFSFNLSVNNSTNVVTTINTQIFTSSIRGTIPLSLNTANSIINPSTSAPNDNVMYHTSVTQTFNIGGLSFFDNFNAINIWFYTSGSVNHIIDDSGSSSTAPLSISQACLLDITKILTPNGYIILKDISTGDKVISKETYQSETHLTYTVTSIYKNKIEEEKHFPFMIPKNFYGEGYPNENLYISERHAFKQKDNLWTFVKNEGFKQVSSEELEILNSKLEYIHLELENGIDKRKYSFIAEGIIVESYVPE